MACLLSDEGSDATANHAAPAAGVQQGDGDSMGEVVV
jgi:hypothetical protein